DVALRDVSVRARVQLVPGCDVSLANYAPGLVVRYEESACYSSTRCSYIACQAGWEAESGSMISIVRGDATGGESDVQTTTSSQQLEGWFTLELSAVGSDVTCAVTEVPELSVAYLDESMKTGTVGLFVEMTQGMFDDFEVLSKEAP